MATTSEAPAKKTKFTPLFIDSLKPKAQKYRLREDKGFTIRVMPTGSKTWTFIYTLNGERHEMTLGSYPAMSVAEARVRHAQEYAKVASKRDPLEAAAAEADRIKEEARQEAERIQAEAEAKVQELEGHANRLQRKIQQLHDAPTVKYLAKEYLIRHAMVKKSSWQEDKRMLNKEVLPIIGNLRLADVTRTDIKQLVENIELRGAPAAAAQMLKIVRRMFSWGIEKDIATENPCTGVKAPKDGERTRALNDSEIATLWKALDRDDLTMGPDIRRILKLILVTAQRPGEVASIHTKDLDPDLRWWTIPADVTKNKREHRVYLTPLARQIIGSADGKEYLFPSPHKKKKTHIDSHAVATAVRRNILHPMSDASGSPLFTPDGKRAVINLLGIAPWGAHDLRRTANTIMAGEKVLFEYRERVLNHTMGKLDRIYNLFDFADEKQAALEKIEQHVLKAIAPKTCSNVVSITTAKDAARTAA